MPVVNRLRIDLRPFTSSAALSTQSWRAAMEVMAVGVEATDPPPEDWEVADDVWPNVTAYEFFTTDGDTLSTVTFARLAVTEDQIRDWQLPTRPTKSTDSSSAGFTARSVEVDAIRPRVLRQLVEDAITSHINPEALHLHREVEEQERAGLGALAGRWSA